MSITTLAGLDAALAKATATTYNKVGITQQLAAGSTLKWQLGGTPPAAAVPSTVATLDETTPEGLYVPRFDTCYIVGVNSIPTAAITCKLYVDRMQHMGGLSGTSVATQTVGLSIPTGRAAADGSDTWWFLYIGATVGTTATTITITYTDQNDVSRTIAIPFGGASPACSIHRCFILVPNTGEYIKTITSCILTGTTGTAGNFGFFCCKPLFFVPAASTSGNEVFADTQQFNMSWIDFGAVTPHDNACIACIHLLTGATTAPTTIDTLTVVNG